MNKGFGFFQVLAGIALVLAIIFGVVVIMLYLNYQGKNYPFTEPQFLGTLIPTIIFGLIGFVCGVISASTLITRDVYTGGEINGQKFVEAINQTNNN